MKYILKHTGHPDILIEAVDKYHAADQTFPLIADLGYGEVVEVVHVAEVQ